MTRHTRPGATRPHAHLPETPTRSSSFLCGATDPKGTQPWTGLSASVCHRCVCSGDNKGVPRSVCLHKSLMLIQGAVPQGAPSSAEKRKLWALLSCGGGGGSHPACGSGDALYPYNSASELTGGESGHPSCLARRRTREGRGRQECLPSSHCMCPCMSHALDPIAWGAPFHSWGN